jgi:hypothetical protein
MWTADHNSSRPRTAAPRLRRGVGMVEMMLSLAISASVLLSVAYAIDVSFKAHAINQEQWTLMQRNRLAMHRILSQIRVTADHQPVSLAAIADFTAGRITSDTGIVMLDEFDNLITYKYDSTNKMVSCMDAMGNEYVLVRGVENFRIKFESMRSPESIRTGGGHDLLMRATVLMTVRTSDQNADVDERAADQTVTLSSSVMPRRNIW